MEEEKRYLLFALSKHEPTKPSKFWKSVFLSDVVQPKLGNTPIHAINPNDKEGMERTIRSLK